jgi:hypothetical protein
MRKFCLGTTFILSAAAMLAVGTPKAQAGLIVDYSLDSGATFVTLLSGASGSTLIAGSTTLGVFALSNLSILSNSPGTASLAKLLSASLDVQNTSGSTASIEFVFSDTGFTAPTAPPSVLLNSHIGGSVTTGNAANLASFTSCISTTNTNLTSCTGATDVAGPGAPAITQDSFNNDQYDIITSLAGPFSISSIWTVTLGAGSDVGFQANASLAPMNVPEPVSMSLLGTALVGLGAIRRRRA